MNVNRTQDSLRKHIDQIEFDSHITPLLTFRTLILHICRVPITVYMRDRRTDSIKVIEEYGQEYGKENPFSVLYHDYGHYDLLKSP